MTSPFNTDMRFTFTHNNGMVLRRENLDGAIVVFLWAWRHFTERGGVVVTDTGGSEFQFLGVKPMYLGAYPNDDAFWELAQAHAGMNR